ncbi:MAG: tryptophan-rich sensory protein [Prochloraceae cyanobacterium]|nr:tryptophan-rich sensory protein [Prochloraceae cyanobacterium]
MNIFPAWLTTAAVTFLMVFAVNSIASVSSEDYRWFARLRRPAWLTFEWAIPFIWIFIFTCGAISASEVWETAPNENYTWILMGCYLLWEVSILVYTPIICKLRSLKAGTISGIITFFVGLILTLLVFPLNDRAAYLIFPHLLWSPIGTFVTWQMMQLNPHSN